MKIVSFFRTVLSYSLIFIVGFIIFMPCIVLVFLPERYRYNKIYFFFTNLFFKTVIYSSFLPINIIGQENLIKDSPAIFAGNHQSSLDIPVMGYVVGMKPHIWLVLDYYAKHFLLGFFVRRMNITVSQKNTSAAAKSLIKAIKYLNKFENMNLIIFPEGRRIKEGKVSGFMKGFAALARSTGLPIIPVYMPNNGKIYPVDAFFIRDYPIKVIIGPPFYYEKEDTDIIFSQRVHDWFVEVSN